MSKEDNRRTWKLEPHICRDCGGRILSAAGNVITGGGNPLFMCADCGQSGSGMSTGVLCWCGAHFKGGEAGVFMCVPIKEGRVNPIMREALQGSGFDLEHTRAVIGVVSTYHLREIERREEAKRE